MLIYRPSAGLGSLLSLILIVTNPILEINCSKSVYIGYNPELLYTHSNIRPHTYYRKYPLKFSHHKHNNNKIRTRNINHHRLAGYTTSGPTQIILLKKRPQIKDAADTSSQRLKVKRETQQANFLPGSFPPNGTPPRKRSKPIQSKNALEPVLIRMHPAAPVFKRPLTTHPSSGSMFANRDNTALDLNSLHQKSHTQITEPDADLYTNLPNNNNQNLEVSWDDNKAQFGRPQEFFQEQSSDAYSTSEISHGRPTAGETDSSTKNLHTSAVHNFISNSELPTRSPLFVGGFQDKPSLNPGVMNTEVITGSNNGPLRPALGPLPPPNFVPHPAVQSLPPGASPLNQNVAYPPKPGAAPRGPTSMLTMLSSMMSEGMPDNFRVRTLGIPNLISGCHTYIFL